MHDEERVLVGVINRKKDFLAAQRERWYRIPIKRIRHYTEVEFIAFFLSGRPFKAQSGGVHYYARVRGVELAYRHQMIPSEPHHPRADERYYRLALSPLIVKAPPILNPTRRPISFIYTTGDRFKAARVIADLYSEADQFVERIYHRLGIADAHIERIWEAQRGQDEVAPGLRITHRPHVIDRKDRAAATQQITLRLADTSDEDAVLAAIRAELAALDTPAIINIPFS